MQCALQQSLAKPKPSPTTGGSNHTLALLIAVPRDPMKIETDPKEGGKDGKDGETRMMSTGTETSKIKYPSAYTTMTSFYMGIMNSWQAQTGRSRRSLSKSY